MATAAPSSLAPVVARFFWMGVGPLVLALTLVYIAKQRDGWIAPSDIAFLVILPGLYFARWIEFKGGDPRIATGEPADREHLRRYLVGVTATGLGLWCVANILGNHVLSTWLISS